MAEILTCVALGELIKRAPKETELHLSEKAKSFLDTSFLGSVRLNVDDYIDTKDGTPADVNEWGKGYGVDFKLEGDYAMAAILSILVNWINGAEHRMCRNGDDYYDGASHSAFKTNVNDLYCIPTKEEGVELYVSESGVPLETFSKKIRRSMAIDLTCPQLELSVDEDFTEEFEGTFAYRFGDKYDIKQVKQITKLRMDLLGAEIKQAAAMSFVVSGCASFTPSVWINTPPYIYITIGDELALAVKTELGDMIFSKSVADYEEELRKRYDNDDIEM